MLRKKLLIVDDNPVVLKLLSAKLETQGYLVLTAADSADALALARREKPDLVLLDLNLAPDSWDGIVLMTWFRRMDETKDIPVIIISSEAVAECKDRCLAAGAVHFFLKPVDLHELLGAIRKALNQDLPAEPAGSPPPPLNPVEGQSPKLAGPPGSKRVLLLEDDVGLGETLQLFLESNSYAVSRVVDSPEGLRQVMAADFDIILCDMVMPTLPGDQFYLAVERAKPHLCKRFIFMTGHHADPKTDNFIRRVRRLMLWKPFSLADLLAAIEVVCKKSTSPALGLADSALKPAGLSLASR
jgi:DNA-binding response OmpR family regulator